MSEQGVAVAATVAEEDTDLAILDLAKTAAVLAFDTTGVIALLGEARAITKEDAV